MVAMDNVMSYRYPSASVGALDACRARYIRTPPGIHRWNDKARNSVRPLGIAHRRQTLVERSGFSSHLSWAATTGAARAVP
jgi:hypothetical protein